MRIQHALVLGAEGRFEEREIAAAAGLFAPVDESDTDILDASGMYALPGLIDIHFHGCMGADFCDGTQEAIRTLAAYEASQGVTAICPATLTLDAEVLKQVLAEGAAFHAGEAEADLVGINMEGPFISRVKKGAQNEAYILPCDAKLAREFVEASEGLVKIIGLAPEENPDFEAYIREVKDVVRVSLAHTNADYDAAKKAFDAGASHAVHLYNAMTGLSHREPGVVGAASDSPEVFCEIICDGIHVHPAAVRAAFRLMGADRMVLISDSLRATGLGDGIIDLGGQDVEVHGRRACLVEGGSIAGSVTNLADCLRYAVQHMGIPLETAAACATINAARAIGVDDRYGSITEGKHANVLLLRKSDLRTMAVIKDGRIIMKAEDGASAC